MLCLRPVLSKDTQLVLFLIVFVYMWYCPSVFIVVYIYLYTLYGQLYAVCKYRGVIFIT